MQLIALIVKWVSNNNCSLLFLTSCCAIESIFVKRLKYLLWLSQMVHNRQCRQTSSAELLSQLMKRLVEIPSFVDTQNWVALNKIKCPEHVGVQIVTEACSAQFKANAYQMSGRASQFIYFIAQCKHSSPNRGREKKISQSKQTIKCETITTDFRLYLFEVAIWW